MVPKEAMTATNAPDADLGALVAAVSEKHDADVITFSGPIQSPTETEFITNCNDSKKRRNVMLMLTTHGGDAHVAYPIARCLQREYADGKFIAYVDTDCESAGTLLVTGADEVVMSDLATLGPIDVQLRKPDEPFEARSGLIPTQALDSLKESAFDYTQDYYLRFKLGPELSTQLALDTATKLTVGLFGPIYAQIDPLQLAENDRFVKIAIEYGERLGQKNLKERGLTRLVSGYPDHSFRIDRKEAEDLFRNVRKPIDVEIALATCLRMECRSQLRAPAPRIRFLTHEFLHRGKGEAGDDDRVSEIARGSAADSTGVEPKDVGTPTGGAAVEPAKIADISAARTAKGA